MIQRPPHPRAKLRSREYAGRPTSRAIAELIPVVVGGADLFALEAEKRGPRLGLGFTMLDYCAGEWPASGRRRHFVGKTRPMWKQDPRQRSDGQALEHDRNENHAIDQGPNSVKFRTSLGEAEEQRDSDGSA